jgi:hypothetical protein
MELISAVQRSAALDRGMSFFYRLAARDADLGPLAERLRGLKPPCFHMLFEARVTANPQAWRIWRRNLCHCYLAGFAIQHQHPAIRLTIPPIHRVVGLSS